MKTTERIFNALLFEAIALAIIIPVSALISGKGTSELVIVGIALSLYTVVWNYFYNLGFDRVFGANREQRTLKTRILHTFGFEGGLIFISIPTIAWFLQIGWLAAMGLEAVFLIFSSSTAPYSIGAMTSISPIRLGLRCKPPRSNSPANINTTHHQTNLTKHFSGSFDGRFETYPFQFLLLSKNAKPVHSLPSAKSHLNMVNTVNESNRPAHSELRLLKYPMNITKVRAINN